MDAALKKILKSVTLALRHLLEGEYDAAGKWHPGDLEQRLAAIGVRRDRAAVPVDELAHLPTDDRQARKIVDAYLKLREEAGVERSEAVAEFIRETAYTWANRLIALRCMESRELVDSVILQQAAYGGRSLEHHRLAQRQPELCAGEDDGLFAVLDKVFREQTKRLPMLFDPRAPGIALRPSAAAIKDCFGLLSLNADSLSKFHIQIKEDGNAALNAEPPNPFVAPDALGWTYQYWNTEEKDRVFEMVRTIKGAKITGADIVPATQLYTEDYMVKFLVQNSLGAAWMLMHPESTLFEQWEYYVRDADRAPAPLKPLREVTFLDPACGSGHFLLEAFDLLYAMYQDEGELTEAKDICDSILTKNIFGIDIDSRAVQIAEAAMWMKAAERSFDYGGAASHLAAATASHLKGSAWEEFLTGFEKEPSVARVLRKFAHTMEHIDEIGSLARPSEDLQAIIKEEHATWEQQIREQKEANFLFPEIRREALSGQLPFHEITDEEFGERLFYRARAGIDAFTVRARESDQLHDQLLGQETRSGFHLVELLSRKYDVIAANPPYMGTTQLSEPVALAVADNENSPDLYCALMLRWIDLQSPGGVAALITRADYLTQSECQEMRRALLERTSISLLIRLENRVFRDLSNPNAIFFSMQVHSVPRRLDTLIAHGGISSSEYEGKADELRELVKARAIKPMTRQNAFERLPRNSFALNLPVWAYEAYEKFPPISAFAAARQGLITGDTSRFLRYRWEVNGKTNRWRTYAKGGEFCRWFGNDCWYVDWELNGSRLRNFVDAETGKQRSRVQNTGFYGRRGATWSSQTISAFATRTLETNSVFDTTGSSVFLNPDSDSEACFYRFMAVLNTPAFGVLFQSIQPGVHYGEGYLETLPCPYPTTLPSELQVAAEECVQLQRNALAYDPSSSQFDPSFYGKRQTITDCSVQCIRELLLLQAHLYRTELGLWTLAETAIGVPEEAQTTSIRRSKAIEGDRLLPRLWRSSGAPTADVQVATQNSFEEACLRTNGRPELAIAEIRNICSADVPADVQKEWIARIVSVNVLLLLGHRWPKQSAVCEAVPIVDDTDTMVPLTPLAEVTTLQDRVIRRFRTEEIDTRYFVEVMGKTIEHWLSTEFFKLHTRQFKRRPIAWQVQSSAFTTQKAPAIACLIYYHKLDADVLRKFRKLAEDCRTSCEIELRGIRSIAAEARSDRQETRRIELEDSVVELQRFDATLEAVAMTGFGPDSLHPTLRQYAIDDAMLSLKARWLRRLSDLIAKSVLQEWLKAACRSGLHPDFGSWISDAISHLDYHCSQVGPKPAAHENSNGDPTSVEIAAIISPTAESMLIRSLSLACQAWWQPLDDAVLAPIRESIKQLKADQKQCEDALKTDPEPHPGQARQLKARIKEIKADLKELNAELGEKAGRGQAVRRLIEEWRSVEPLGWGDWHANQPLFDQISSLDGRRPPPTTIVEFIAQESLYVPDINDGVRVNIAPLQKAGLLAADVLAAKDIDKAIADRAEWRADERCWVREGKLPQPGWWPTASEGGK